MTLDNAKQATWKAVSDDYAILCITLLHAGGNLNILQLLMT